MAMDFERVIAFEPVDKHRECWYTNMDGVDNAMLRHSALGASDGYIGLKNYTLGSHGDTCVSDDLDTEVVATAEMTTLDHLNIQDVDLIKIDVEGFEHNVLSGAMKTLQQRPVIIIEQKTNQDALPILEQMGAIQREVIKGDYIYSWD
jgi:FkbM family methyltransferase